MPLRPQAGVGDQLLLVRVDATIVYRAMTILLAVGA